MDKQDILLIDKPAGWTSFDVVAKIRGQIRAKYTKQGIKPTKRQLKVGHAGTLDPFATGLLIILLGEATKKADTFLKLDKTYEFTAELGKVSSTGDIEGEIIAKSDKIPTAKEVKYALAKFTGEITQTPPVYSAIKIGGQRAYKLARAGKEVEIPSRKVNIYYIKLISYKYPFIKVECSVSSGTYIRSLVEDIGEALKTGAYCQQLRRLSIDKYSVKSAQKIEDLELLDKKVIRIPKS